MRAASHSHSAQRSSLRWPGCPGCCSRSAIHIELTGLPIFGGEDRSRRLRAGRSVGNRFCDGSVVAPEFRRTDAAGVGVNPVAVPSLIRPAARCHCADSLTDSPAFAQPSSTACENLLSFSALANRRCPSHTGSRESHEARRRECPAKGLARHVKAGVSGKVGTKFLFWMADDAKIIFFSDQWCPCANPLPNGALLWPQVHPGGGA